MNHRALLVVGIAATVASASLIGCSSPTTSGTPSSTSIPAASTQAPTSQSTSTTSTTPTPGSKLYSLPKARADVLVAGSSVFVIDKQRNPQSDGSFKRSLAVYDARTGRKRTSASIPADLLETPMHAIHTSQGLDLLLFGTTVTTKPNGLEAGSNTPTVVAFDGKDLSEAWRLPLPKSRSSTSVYRFDGTHEGDAVAFYDGNGTVSVVDVLRGTERLSMNMSDFYGATSTFVVGRNPDAKGDDDVAMYSMSTGLPLFSGCTHVYHDMAWSEKRLVCTRQTGALSRELVSVSTDGSVQGSVTETSKEVATPAVIAGGADVVVFNQADGVVGYAGATMTKVWTIDHGTSFIVEGAQDRLVYGQAHGQMVAIDAVTGKQAWAGGDSAGSKDFSRKFAVLGDEVVLFGTFAGSEDVTVEAYYKPGEVAGYDGSLVFLPKTS